MSNKLNNLIIIMNINLFNLNNKVNINYKNKDGVSLSSQRPSVSLTQKIY
jgi:hypothetical protein